MKRKLVAALACRNQGSRLYGKPLQNLDFKKKITILDNIISCLKSTSVIDEIVLGISKGKENLIFKDIAKKNKIKYIVGDKEDVLKRLIQCGVKSKATDVFRVTTESPFIYYNVISKLWNLHKNNNADATVVWDIIDGLNFEIFKLKTLKTSHLKGLKRHKSELCSLYLKENIKKFRVIKFKPPREYKKKHLRLTVDYPEDLVVCRYIYNKLQKYAPKIPINKIINLFNKKKNLSKILKEINK